MGIKRIGKHLLAHRWRLRRLFPAAVLANIEQAIKAGEAGHAGQVRVVVTSRPGSAPSTSFRSYVSGTPPTTTAS